MFAEFRANKSINQTSDGRFGFPISIKFPSPHPMVCPHDDEQEI
jgi:hypothetical protein